MGEEGCIEDEKFFNLETSNFLIKKGNKDILKNDFNDNIKSETNLIITDSNRISIGKENPEYSLDVNGDINITGDYRKNGIIINTGGTGNDNWSNNGNNIYYDSGNVGIGTTDPQEKLDINGNLNITGNYLQNGSILKTGYWEESDNKIYYDSGNVGIGTTDPQEKLDINGNLNITGNYLQNGSILKTGYWEESDNKIYYDSGNVGIGTTDPQEKLHLVGDFKIGLPFNEVYISDYSIGRYHTLILLNTGKVLSIGDNQYGQLGDGTRINRNYYVEVESANGYTKDNAIAVDVSLNKRSFILLNTGRVLSFGQNYLGINNSDESSNIPVSLYNSDTDIYETQYFLGMTFNILVSPRTEYDDSNAIAITSNNFDNGSDAGPFNMILLNTGKIVMFGDNLNLGVTDKDYVVELDSQNSSYNGSNATSITIGNTLSMILLDTGKVLSFGRNELGQLGNGNNTNSTNLVEVESSNGYTKDNAIAISCGSFHSMILLNTGKVLSFGSNIYGQLGNGTSGTDDSSNVPIAVSTDSSNGNDYDGSNAIAIACGEIHSMILLNTGKVLSFGNNNYGQLGNGSTTSSNIPIEVDLQSSNYDGTNAIKIFGSYQNSAILLNDGMLVVIGTNIDSQLGLNVQSTYVPLNTNIQSQYYIKNKLVNNDSFNELLVYGNAQISNKVDIYGILNVDSDVNISNTLESDDSSTGALVVSGGVGIAKNTYIGGILNVDSDVNINGITQSDNSSTGALVISGGVGIAKNTYIGGTLNVDSGVTFNSTTQSTDSTTGALVVSGGVGIAKNTYIGGTLNVDSDANISGNITTKILNQFTENEIKSIACGGLHSMILLNTGKVLGFGLNNKGHLGIGNNTSRIYYPVEVDSQNSDYNGSNAIAISCGASHSMILLNTGKIISFGRNIYGQLGNGLSGDSEEVNVLPIEVDSQNSNYDGSNAIAIAGSDTHSIILLNTGEVLSYGLNNQLQLGDGTNISSTVPVAVSTTSDYDGSNAIIITSGGAHSMILLNTGKVLSFGKNIYGQLGDGTNINRNEPVEVDSQNNGFYDGSNAIAIDCEGNHSIILLNTGKVLSFGYNNDGQLGDGSTTQRDEPVAVSTTAGYDGSNAIAIVCGSSHSMILLNTGKVLSFGLNGNGQLGDGTNISSTVPVAVSTTGGYDGSNAIAIACGGSHSIILLNTGKILSFGYGVYGQLGNGNTNKNEPTAVSNTAGYDDSNVKTIYNTFEIGGNFNNAITNNYLKIYTESKYLSTDDAETKSFSGFYPNHLNIKNTITSSKIQFLNSNDEVDLSIGANQIELNNDVNISGILNVDNDININKNASINKAIIPFDGNEYYTLNNKINTHNNIWTQLGIDIDGENAQDEAGFSVSLSADGSVIAIGARKNDDSGNNSGNVRVFKFVSKNWTQMGSSIKGDAVDDESGYSVSLNSNGKILAVSSPNYDNSGLTNSGQVKIYNFVDNEWTQLGESIKGDLDYSRNGYSISLNSIGNIIAIGEAYYYGSDSSTDYYEKGRVRVYKLINNVWSQIGQNLVGLTAKDYFGKSVSLNYDGSILAIGATGSDSANGLNDVGSVITYQYSENNNTWIQIGDKIYGKAEIDPESEGEVILYGLNNDISLSSNEIYRIKEIDLSNSNLDEHYSIINGSKSQSTNFEDMKNEFTNFFVSIDTTDGNALSASNSIQVIFTIPSSTYFNTNGGTSISKIRFYFAYDINNEVDASNYDLGTINMVSMPTKIKIEGEQYTNLNQDNWEILTSETDIKDRFLKKANHINYIDGGRSNNKKHPSNIDLLNPQILINEQEIDDVKPYIELDVENDNNYNENLGRIRFTFTENSVSKIQGRICIKDIKYYGYSDVAENIETQTDIIIHKDGYKNLKLIDTPLTKLKDNSIDSDNQIKLNYISGKTRTMALGYDILKEEFPNNNNLQSLEITENDISVSLNSPYEVGDTVEYIVGGMGKMISPETIDNVILYGRYAHQYPSNLDILPHLRYDSNNPNDYVNEYNLFSIELGRRQSPYTQEYSEDKWYVSSSSEVFPHYINFDNTTLRNQQAKIQSFKIYQGVYESSSGSYTELSEFAPRCFALFGSNDEPNNNKRSAYGMDLIYCTATDYDEFLNSLSLTSENNTTIDTTTFTNLDPTYKTYVILGPLVFYVTHLGGTLGCTFQIPLSRQKHYKYHRLLIFDNFSNFNNDKNIIIGHITIYGQDLQDKGVLVSPSNQPNNILPNSNNKSILHYNPIFFINGHNTTMNRDQSNGWSIRRFFNSNTFYTTGDQFRSNSASVPLSDVVQPTLDSSNNHYYITMGYNNNIIQSITGDNLIYISQNNFRPGMIQHNKSHTMMFYVDTTLGDGNDIYIYHDKTVNIRSIYYYIIGSGSNRGKIYFYARDNLGGNVFAVLLGEVDDFFFKGVITMIYEENITDDTLASLFVYKDGVLTDSYNNFDNKYYTTVVVSDGIRIGAYGGLNELDITRSGNFNLYGLATFDRALTSTEINEITKDMLNEPIAAPYRQNFRTQYSINSDSKLYDGNNLLNNYTTNKTRYSLGNTSSINFNFDLKTEIPIKYVDIFPTNNQSTYFPQNFILEGLGENDSNWSNATELLSDSNTFSTVSNQSILINDSSNLTSVRLNITNTNSFRYLRLKCSNIVGAASTSSDSNSDDNYIELGGIRIISEKTLIEGDISNYNKFYGLTDSTNHQTGDLNKLFNGKNNFPENILSIKYQNPNNLNDTLQYYNEGYKFFDYNIFNKSDDINIDIDIKRDIKFAGSSVFFQKDVNFYYPKNINIYGSTDNNSWTLLKNNNNILITDSGTNDYTRINTSTRLIENLFEPYETNNKYRYIRFNFNTLTDSNLTTPDIFFKIKNFGDYRLGDLEIYEWKGKEYEQMNETDNFIEMVFTIHKQIRLSELNIFPNNINANNDPNNFLFLKDFKVYGSNDRQSIQRNKNWTQIYNKQLTIPISDFDGNYTTNTITDSNTALISFFDENLINTYTYYKIKIYNRYNDSYNQTTPFLNIGELLFKKIDSVIVPDNYSIDLSVDGYTLAIGSPLNNILNQNKGYVRIYKWINNSWNQLGSDIEGNNNLNQTGYSLSLNANGTIIAIGSPGNSSGFVSIYQWFNNTWNQIGTDIIGEGISDQSGFSVSINADGTTVGIGARLNDGNGLDAGHVRVYNLGELFSSINIEGDINVSEKCLIGNLELENNKLSSLNGDLILMPSNLGRIGINQDNPQEKLDINGNTLINGDLNVKGNSKLSNLNLFYNEISSITENIILSPFNSSNVGIGTSNPQTTLHVVGSTIIEENINVSGIGTINNIEINNNKISSKIENIILSPFENTKVGIRTENPIQEIHIEGNTLINGNIDTTGIGTISNIEINNNIISSKDSDNIIIIPNNNTYLGIDQKIPEEKIDIRGGIKFKGSLNANNTFDISCGVNHTAILLNTGKILTFGDNQNGQLLLNSFDDKAYPTSIDETRSNYDGTNAIQVVANTNATTVLLKTGEILTGGLNNRGQLGYTDTSITKKNHLSPVGTTGTSDSDYNGTNAIFIYIGDMSHAALLKTGKVITWGIENKYSLGRVASFNQKHPPGQVDEDKSDYNGTNAVSVSVGYSFMLILLNTGKIISFGRENNYGQLGINQTVAQNTNPKDQQYEVDSANGYKKDNAIAIASGSNHSLILLNNGKVLSFGLNDNGQLGDSSNINSNIPIEITYTNGYNGYNASYISCGNKHSIILLNTGKVLTFGLNNYGQLGVGNTENSNIPIEPSNTNGYDGTNCIKICLNSMNSYSTSLILNTGVILACGKNFTYTLDNMDTENGDYEGPELNTMNIDGIHQMSIGSYNIRPKFDLYANTYIYGMLNVHMISSIPENIILDPENSSNIGIGTKEPQEKLDINGNLNITGNYLQNGSILKTGYWEESNNKIYYDSGNVGIGTTNPQEKLEVNGNVNITGNLNVDSDINISNTTQSTDSLTGALTINGGVGISKNTYIGGNLNVDGKINIFGFYQDDSGNLIPKQTDIYNIGDSNHFLEAIYARDLYMSTDTIYFKSRETGKTTTLRAENNTLQIETTDSDGTVINSQQNFISVDINSNPQNGQVILWDSYNSVWKPGNISGGGSATQINDLLDVNTSTTTPTNGQTLIWDSANNQWKPGTINNISNHTTDSLNEGSTNLYYTDSRTREAISINDNGGDGSLSYDSSTGVITYTGPSDSEVRAHFSDSTGVTITNGQISIGQSVGIGDSVQFSQVTAALIGNVTGTVSDISNHTTDSLSEGSNNLYYTDSRTREAISINNNGGDGSLSYDSSTGVITYTGPSDSEVRSHFSGGVGVTIINGEIAIGQSVGTGDSVQFSQVTAALIGNVTGTVSDISNHTTDSLSEGSNNLYYTDSRTREAISVNDQGGDGLLSYDSSTGVITYTGPSDSEVRSHFSGGVGVTITNGEIAIGQSVGTGDNVTFNQINAIITQSSQTNITSVGTLTSLSVDNLKMDGNTISSTNTDGDITIDTNGTGKIYGDNVIVNNIKNNLMDTNIWSTQSSGQISSDFGGYSLNQSASGENNMLINEIGPFGNYEYVWKCLASGNGGSDGGWNYDIDNVDYKFGYLSVVYFKVVDDTSGKFNHGCLQNGVFLTDGTTNISFLRTPRTDNPYFVDISLSNFEENKWYISIGVILPYKSGGYSPAPTTIGGIYKLSTGEKLSTLHYNFMMKNTTTTQKHRAYLSYSSSNLSELHFARPGFYKINGTEPTLTELLGGNTIDKSHIGDMGQSDHAGFSHVNNATTTNYALLQNNSGDTFINAASNQDISFRINDNDKMIIDSSGNVGIGTTTPTEKLDVNGNIKTNGNLIGNVTGNITGDVTGTVSDISNHTTDSLSEGSINLYYTDSRTREAISVNDINGDGSLSYDSSTGVITYTGPSDSEVRAHFSDGTGVTITNGQISIGQDVSTISSVQFSQVTANLIGNVTGTVSSLNNHSINALSDVNTTTTAPTNGQVLMWDSANSEWKPGTITSSTPRTNTRLYTPSTPSNTFVVTVGNKTSSHRYNTTDYSNSSNSSYFIDGTEEAPFIELIAGETYNFDQSDSTNTGHPIVFYTDDSHTSSYTTGVTVTGTAGSSGSNVELVVTYETPCILYYQCSNHIMMGNQLNIMGG